MNWFALYVGAGIPILLVVLGYGLAHYDRWERRRASGEPASR